MTTDSAAGSPVRLSFDAFELDEGNARLTRNGAPLSLPPKAFAPSSASIQPPIAPGTVSAASGPRAGIASYPRSR